MEKVGVQIWSSLNTVQGIYSVRYMDLVPLLECAGFNVDVLKKWMVAESG